jgi:hypothetical protein
MTALAVRTPWAAIVGRVCRLDDREQQAADPVMADLAIQLVIALDESDGDAVSLIVDTHELVEDLRVLAAEVAPSQ